MRLLVSCLFACASALAIPPPAFSQTRQIAPASSNTGLPARIEVTVEAALMAGLLDLSALRGDPQMGLSGIGADLRVRLSSRVGLGLRGLAAVGGEVSDSQFYDVAAIVHLRSSDRSRAFLRFGAGGHHELLDVQESRRLNQDHSTTVFPAYRHHKLTYPNFVVAGLAATRVVSRRVGMTAELDAVAGGGVAGFGIRASAGVTLPLGGYQP